MSFWLWSTVGMIAVYIMLQTLSLCKNEWISILGWPIPFKWFLQFATADCSEARQNVTHSIFPLTLDLWSLKQTWNKPTEWGKTLKITDW